MQPTYNSPGFNSNFKSTEFTPTILKREQLDPEKEYFGLLKSGDFLEKKNLQNFVSQFPIILTSLLDKCENDDNRRRLLNTALCNEYCETIQDQKMIIKLYLDTKPIIYSTLAGDIQLLRKIDQLLPESYKLKLSNGFNLLHCLIEGECPNVENAKSCINFLLNKNTEMLNERDEHYHTPLDLCSKTLYILEHTIGLHKQNLEVIKNYTANDSAAKHYLKIQQTLISELSDFERRAKNLTIVRDFLQNKALYMFLKKDSYF